MKRFGEELKAVRESKNISLQDISKATRINTKFIEAIEAGNLSILPPTYIRAFIKSYAKNVGLNQEDTITRYEQYSSGKIPDTKTKNLKTEESDESQKVAQHPQTEQPPKAIEPTPTKTDEAIPKTSTTETTKDIPAKDISKNKQNISEEVAPQGRSSSFIEPVPKEENKGLENADYNAPKEHVKYLETPKVNYFAIFSVIAIVLVLLVFVVFKIPFKQTTEPVRVPIDTIVKEIKEEEESKQTENLTTDTFSQPEITYPTVKPDSLLLGILSETDVWVSVRMDKDGADRGMVNANTMKYVTAKERFTITSVRGRQIKIYLNNNFLGNLSQTDSLRSAIVTLNGIVYVKPSTPTPATPRLDDTDLKPLEPVFR